MKPSLNPKTKKLKHRIFASRSVMNSSIISLTHGTAIAAIVNEHEFLLAIDSRVVDGHNKELGEQEKFGISGDIIFACHGLASHKETGYELFAMVNKAIEDSANIYDAAKRVTESLMRPILAALQYIHGQNPEFLRNRPPEISGVVLARWEEDRPVMYWVRFEFQLLDTKVRLESKVDAGSNNGVFVSPESGDGDRFVEQNPTFTSGDIASTAKKFVQEQIDKGYPSVGPPIHIIRLIDGNFDQIQ